MLLREFVELLEEKTDLKFYLQDSSNFYAASVNSIPKCFLNREISKGTLGTRYIHEKEMIALDIK